MPAKRLSYQKHSNRNEHWSVISASALAMMEQGKIPCWKQDEAIDIPREAAHRVSNPGRSPFVFIEIQRGGYLGKDDIIELEDDSKPFIIGSIIKAPPAGFKPAIYDFGGQTLYSVELQRAGFGLLVQILHKSLNHNPRLMFNVGYDALTSFSIDKHGTVLYIAARKCQI